MLKANSTKLIAPKGGDINDSKGGYQKVEMSFLWPALVALDAVYFPAGEKVYWIKLTLFNSH